MIILPINYFWMSKYFCRSALAPPHNKVILKIWHLFIFLWHVMSDTLFFSTFLLFSFCSLNCLSFCNLTMRRKQISVKLKLIWNKIFNISQNCHTLHKKCISSLKWQRSLDILNFLFCKVLLENIRSRSMKMLLKTLSFERQVKTLCFKSTMTMDCKRRWWR